MNAELLTLTYGAFVAQLLKGERASGTLIVGRELEIMFTERLEL